MRTKQQTSREVRTLGINEEFQRLILRARWMVWAEPRIKRSTLRKMMQLSHRLTRWKPTYTQRLIGDLP